MSYQENLDQWSEDLPLDGAVVVMDRFRGKVVAYANCERMVYGVEFPDLPSEVFWFCRDFLRRE